MKFNNNIMKLIFFLLLLEFVFVIADYLEMFVVLQKDGKIKISFQFKIKDTTTQKPLSGVSIEAYYSNRLIKNVLRNNNKPDSNNLVKGYLYLPWAYKRTIFFKKPNFHNWAKGKKIEFILKCPSYQPYKRKFFIPQLNKTQIIELVPSQN